MKWLVASAVLFATTADAHPLDIGYLRVTANSATVDITLDLNIDAASNLVGAPKLDATTAPAHAAALADATYRRAPITTPSGPCTWATPVASIEGQSLRVRDTATCPGGTRTWTFPFVRDVKLSTSFELLVKETIDGEERVKLIDRYEPAYTFGTQARGFFDFVRSGIEHIGVAPNQWRDDRRGLHLPDGIDHILFLLALLLGGGRALRLLGIATGFTVGHSITLALATLDVVRPPASVIEPIVALSIALAAAEAFWGKWEQHRWKIASLFGLVHGFAFATAILELDLSSGGTAKALFGFNLGVELGQVVLVLIFAPLVTLAHKDDVAKKYVLRAIAAAIFVAGMYWFFSRL